jgi:hypothetical protein
MAIFNRMLLALADTLFFRWLFCGRRLAELHKKVRFIMTPGEISSTTAHHAEHRPPHQHPAFGQNTYDRPIRIPLPLLLKPTAAFRF